MTLSGLLSAISDRNRITILQFRNFQISNPFREKPNMLNSQLWVRLRYQPDLFAEQLFAWQ
jgi:hypothetical protein